MSFQEQIANTTDCGFFEGAIPVKYEYTMGNAGDKFFRTMMEKGEIVASRCSKCGKLYVPPSTFCEADDCFSPTSEFQPIDQTGEVYSWTESHVDMAGNRHDKPQVYAMVKFNGVEGAIIHRLNAEASNVKIGMKVKPVFKEAAKREGNMEDIQYFTEV
jgi:uncharacterized OB-fold protein